jgi:hypothetical protein
MPTHTPATALAAVLNELMILAADTDRSAESWRHEVQQLIEQARPSSSMFLERERIARDTAHAAAAIQSGARVVYTNGAEATIALPSEEAQHIDAFERELVETGQATAYVFEDGKFREITVTRDDGGPLTNEEVAIMMREGWGEHRNGA